MSNLNFEPAKKIIDADTTIFWFRRDLRVEDNAGLYHALKANKKVLPLFIFDSQILDKLDDEHDRRVDFIHQSLQILKDKLNSLGSDLLVVYGDPIDFYKSISPYTVYANHDYEPYGRKRDEQVNKILQSKKSALLTFKDQVIFEKDEIIKDDRTPYTVFTPYSKKWKSKLSSFFLKSYSVEKYTKNLLQIKRLPFPGLEEIGFKKSDVVIPDRTIKTSVIKKYHEQRDYPALAGTSRLSVHLRFGTVSIRKLAVIAKKTNDTWLNELIWRDFYHMILWHFPHVEKKAFKPAYDHIKWRNNDDEYKAWYNGLTGYPIVDAGMRELNATGFMHNRVRMVTASFLTKHLLIDWRWGEAYFAKKLLDFDMAANNGGWQWAAGSGCDAAPYFRVFNPDLQTEKFDSELKYIRKWVPEYESTQYVTPIVDHKFARERAIKTYQNALNQLQL